MTFGQGVKLQRVGPHQDHHPRVRVQLFSGLDDGNETQVFKCGKNNIHTFKSPFQTFF